MAENTPSKAVSSSNIETMNSLTRSSIAFHVERIETALRRVVSSTSSRLIPSRPT